MVRHVIIWKLKPQESGEQLAAVKAGIREGLEGLQGQIPGLLEIRVHTEGLPSSNGDLMLDSLFADAEALAAYSVHPAHVTVANTKVRPFTELRSCFDYPVLQQKTSLSGLLKKRLDFFTISPYNNSIVVL